MSITTQIAWDDTVLPFQLDRTDIRGRIARLDGVLEDILGQHDYPAPVESLVCEMALLTALIGQAVKLRWKLSLQVRGDGPVGLIASDFFAPEAPGEPAHIRAYANFMADHLGESAPVDLIGQGHFGILIDQGPGTTPYQGITPISGGSIAASAETYFAQSEQLPTRFKLRFGQSTLPGQDTQWRAGGVMLQQMPKASPAFGGDGATGQDGLLVAADLLNDDEGENWSRANILLDTVEEMELIGPQVQTTEVLLRLFHEEIPRVFDPVPVRFGCTCSAAKVEDSLAAYPSSEIAEMVTEDGVVTADCQFCGAHYEFNPATLGSEAAENGDAG